MLAQIPPPQSQDIEERSQRMPLIASERKSLFLKYAGGLSMLIIIYVVLTVIRDFRDNYAVELMNENGYAGNPEVFAQSEIIIGLVVLVGIAFLVKVKSHIKGLKVVLLLCGSGLILVAISTLLLEQKLINPFVWMVAQGIGIYIGYVPFQIVLFERFLAAFKEPGNVGFLMYISDSTGYLGSVILSLLIQSSMVKINWTQSFVNLSYVGGLFGLIMVFFAFNFFQRKLRSLSSINFKPIVSLSLIFFLISSPSFAAFRKNRSFVLFNVEMKEQQLLDEFKSAAAIFRGDPDKAIKAFGEAFFKYEILQKEGKKFSEAFYQEVLILSRQMRLTTISRQFIEHQDAAYPSKKEHCDCGKCHK